MSRHNNDWIDELIASQRPGYSLDQAFYRNPQIFARDLERVICNHWMMAGHVSQIPRPGDQFLFEVAGRSVVIHRGENASVLAHDKAPCHVQLLEGLILVCLAPGDPPSLEGVAKTLKPFLQLQGIGEAQVAKRKSFELQANWKLAVENYLECYHCKPAHPQYSRVEIKVERFGDGSPAALARFEERYRTWRNEVEQKGAWIEDAATKLPLDERLPRAQFCAAYRAPLRAEYTSATEDGQPAAPLMGEFKDYDGGETAIGLGPFTYMLAANDHAVFFQFIPSDAENSEMIVTWLVQAEAEEGRDYDLQRLTWLWTLTTLQDKTIIEANRAGIYSRHYQTGPASLLEADVTGFRNWYLALIGPENHLSNLKPGTQGRYFGL